MSKSWKQHPLTRIAKMTTLVIIGFSVFFSGCLLVLQRTMIFPGTMVLRIELDNLPDNVQRIEHETSQGRQVFYYRHPGEGADTLPSPLWVCFHGNASAALHWLDFLERYPDQSAGFLLLDFPGYVECEGKPSPRTILESAQSALVALADHLETDVEELRGDLAVLGFSIGTGGAFDFAAKEPAHTIVAISPFTSLLDMARRTTFWPFYHLLLFRFDNVARLSEIYQREDPPRVAIIHGANDEIIPVAHSRKMVEMFPDIVYHEITMGDHNFLLDSAKGVIWNSMLGDKVDDSGEEDTAPP